LITNTFDANILLSELYRYGLYAIVEDFSNIPQFCTSLNTAPIIKLKFNKKQYKEPKLKELYKWLFKVDLNNDDLHNALADTRFLSECFFELLKRNFFVLQ